MKYVAILDSDNELSEDAIKEIKESVFIGDEKAPYCFDITSVKKALDQGSVLDKIRSEIEEKYGGYDICEWFEDYDYEENDISEYQQVGKVSDILEIINKYKIECEE